MSELLERLDDTRLRKLLPTEEFIRKASLKGNQRLRLQVEDLAIAYANGMPYELFANYLRDAETVLALPAVTHLGQPQNGGADKSVVYPSTLDNRSVSVKLPLFLSNNDNLIDEYFHAIKSLHPVLVRAFDPATRVWRRAVAWKQ